MDEQQITYESVKKKIDDLNNLRLEDIDSIISLISETTIKEADELYIELIKNIREQILEEYSRTDDKNKLESSIKEITNFLLNRDKSIESILIDQEFDFDLMQYEKEIGEDEFDEFIEKAESQNINKQEENQTLHKEEQKQPEVSVEMESYQREIDKIEFRIKDFENKYSDYIPNAFINIFNSALQDINKNIEVLSQDKETNIDQIKKLESQANELKAEIESIKTKDNEASQKAMKKVIEKYNDVSYNSLSSVIINNIENEIEQEIEDLNKQLQTEENSLEETNKKLETLQTNNDALVLTEEEIKEIESLTEELNRRNEPINYNQEKENLEKELHSLKEKQSFIWNQGSNDLVIDTDLKDLEEIEKRIKKINSDLNKIESIENNKEFKNLTDEQLKNELNNLTEKQMYIWNQGSNDLGIETDLQDLEIIESKIAAINLELNKRKSQEKDKFSNLSDEQLKNELNKLTEKREYLWNQGSNDLALDSDLKDLEELGKRIEELKNELNKRNNKSKYANMSDEQIKQKIAEIQDKIKKQVPDKKEQLEELERQKEEITAKINNIKAKLKDKENQKLELAEITQLKEIREAYNQILNDATSKFTISENNKDLISEIANFVNKHEKLKVIHTYENKDKLEQELIENIYLNVKNKDKEKPKNKKEPVQNIEKNPKLWIEALKKATVFTTGFAAGLVASNIPGVGTIRMTAAAVKLGVAAVNLWTKKHPEGKIAQKLNKTNDKLNEKYPKIMKTVQGMRKKLKQTPLNCFINGVAAGYLVGNAVEMITGENVFEYFSDKTSAPIEPVVENLPEPEIDPVAVADPVIPIEPTIPQPGDVLDLSALPEGLVSSDATNAVSLIQELGSEVEFDKAVTLPDGKIMWHFKQLNGAGYAWFDSKDVMELLSKQATNVTTNSI